MKTGEFYRSIYNCYVSKVTKVSRNNVILENRYGVEDVVALENFDLNWRRCATIYEYRDTIAEAFPEDCELTLRGECVVVSYDEGQIEFAIIDDMLRVQFTDDVKDALDADSNVMEFLLEDALDVISMIADLFYED